jgi:hypothetical protein
MYAMPPYPYLATDYGTQLSLFTHHMWIGGFCVVGAGAHAAIFMVRDYDPTNNYNNLLDRVIRHRDAIISHLNWVCIFLGFHSFGLYIHNDTMSALGRPQDMFSDTAIQLQPVFAQWIQNTHFTAPQLTAPNALAATSLTWGGDVLAVGGKVAMMPISLGTADFLVWLVLDQVKLRYMLETLVLMNRILYHLQNKKIALYNKMYPFYNAIHKVFSHNLNHFLNLFDFYSHQEIKLLGVMENLLDRVNQPVTTQKASTKSFKQVGTSETIREAVLKKSNFDFTDYNLQKPEHIKTIDPCFFIWFIGFIEGDGSFWVRDTNTTIGCHFIFDSQTKRAEFEITQHIDNIKLLKRIRTKLGFGRVIIFEKNGFMYCRWYTSERKNITRLIHLLNGNLILEKRRNQFLQWLHEINNAWDLKIKRKPFNCKVSLKHSWLSGFSDADAGFYTNVKTHFKGTAKPKGNFYVKFVTKYYITQRDEINLLTEIKNLVGSNNQINAITNGKTAFRYNRLEIYKAESTDLLIKYFTQFPLKGIRKIDLLRWARVHAYKNMHVVTTEAAAEKLAKLLLNLQEPLIEEYDLLSVANDFSDEEKNIFINLPLNQRHQNYLTKNLKKLKK